MGIKIKQGLKINLRTKVAIASLSTGVLGVTLFLLFSGYFTTGIKQDALAAGTETIPSGSFIVNMGVSPQTFANGLVPYGMIFELTNTHNVPIKWVIEPSKAKDGIDFTHNSVSYKGGAFIIPAPYITPAITTVINNWKAMGVVGAFSVSSMNLPVYTEITSFPLVIIDTLSLNDSIIANYFTNARIPASAYTKGSPSNINSCHDMWVNPHGDPAWSTHGYLYDFVTIQKSFIWMQCHAVSMMESCQDLSAPFNKLNYLTSDGLQCYQSGKCQLNLESHAKSVPTPTAYFYPADPIMQFLGGVASITSGGSERWFIPKTTGGWRGTTKVLMTVGSTVSPRQGVQMVYGPAYGNSANGQVMYMGGHDMNSGSVPDMVAGQRSFFNFLLLAGKSKSPALTKTVPGIMNANAVDTFQVNVTGGSGPYTYTWSSSNGGTFGTPNSSITSFATPHTEVPIQTIITCVVLDACGRRNFFSIPMTINASPLPITLISFGAKIQPNGEALLNWVTATEIDNDYFTILKSKDGMNYTFLNQVKSKGNSNSSKYYSLIDPKPYTGVTYYKLTQTDYNGHIEDVRVIKLDVPKFRGISKISVWPNPFNSQISIRVPAGKSGEMEVKMWSIDGKLIESRVVHVDDMQNEIHIDDLDKVPAGNYILKVYNEGETSDGFKLTKY